MTQNSIFNTELEERLNEVHVPKELLLMDTGMCWRFLERGYLLYVKDTSPEEIIVHLIAPPENDFIIINMNLEE